MKLLNTSKALLLCAVLVPSINAMTLKESIQKVMVSNPEVIAERNNQKAFKHYIDEREGNYYPRIDIDGRLEKSRSKKRYDDGPEAGKVKIGKEDGYNVGIALNQILYDGNLTPTRVYEAEHNYAANNFRTQRNIDNVVFETIRAYTDFIKYNELLVLTKSMITTNEENLQIAKEKESISGEVLETYQVDSKLNFVKEKYFEEEDLKSSRRSTFKRYVGVLPDGTECRPKIDMSKIPATLEETVRKAVLNNTEVLEQIERIKAQREKIAQADSKFLPNLGLELKTIRDKDLALNEEGLETQSFGRLKLTWNLFNGGGDYAVSKQEEFFLKEQKQRLDAITKKVVEGVKVDYQRLQKNEKRIQVLKQYVQANENIVKVYKDEFDSGTRTFVDILDAQTVLYEAKKSLINREYELYNDYYSLLNKLAILTDTIVSSEDDECAAPANLVQKDTDNSNEELGLLLGDEDDTSKVGKTLASETTENENIPSSTEESATAFLDAPSGYYTINMATKKGLDRANKFVNDNNLTDFKAYTYEFGPQMKSAKVIYGVFKTAKEARNAIRTLPRSLKATKPYVDNLSKHQKLYRKYH